MKRFYQMILHDLKTTGSLIAKQMILKHADELDKKMFKFAYDPDKVYNLKYKNVNWKSVEPFTSTDAILLYRILDKNIIGNKAKEAIQVHCALYGDLVKLIVSKDLDCGITAKSLNKAFGKDFIYQFKAQKAVEIPIKDVKVPILGQIKYNGIRCITHIHENKVEFRTYNGKLFKYDELENIILQGLAGLDLQPFTGVLDGELCIGDSRGTNHTEVKVNSSIRTGKSIVGTPYTFNVFDTMSLDEFDNQTCNRVYRSRFAVVEDIISYINNPLVKVSETFQFTTHKEIEDKFSELLDLGYEGMILKLTDHLYKFKKTKDWIKLKDVKEADIRCIGTTEGKDKYEGMIGALICEGVIEGKLIKVNIGLGLTDEDRAKDPDEYINEIIEMKYNSVILDKVTNIWSLFLGRFVAVRFDK